MTSELFVHGYALLIGVDESQESRLALPTVQNDIDALYNVLVHPQRCAYPADNVRKVMGQAATRSGILDGLDWLRICLQNDGSDNATAVFYYSGHGWQSTERDYYCLLPYDVNPHRIRSSALDAAVLAEEIEQLQPRRLLVILDCCHAAGMGAKELTDLGAGFVQAPAPTRVMLAPAAQQATVSPAAVAGAKGMDALQQGHGRAVLSSCQGDEKSYLRSDGQMSIFTFHLIEALTGHAQPPAGAPDVLVSDLLSHVHRTVPQTAQRDLRRPQHPDFLVTGNFPVALVLGGKGISKGASAPDPLAPLETAPTVSASPAARNVSITGNVTDSPIVTGDGNSIQYAKGNDIAQATGGGNATVDRSFRMFDQRGQKVETQYNIAGDLNMGAANNRAEAVQALQKLLDEVSRAANAGVLGAETALDVDYQLKKAIQQAQKPDPAPAPIVEHLQNAKAIIGEVAANVAAATGLVTAVTSAIQMIQKLF
ncbi:MAG: caspase family protein [Caldilineaceae bacterium]|nr:caspase family protein [Caldilineaceae bacterium]